MGLLERKELEGGNPSRKFLEWKSKEGKLSYYDKNLKEKVLVELPLKFLVIEEYSTVKGFSDKYNSGIFSNEVLYVSKEPLTVKAHKGGVLGKGLYKDIKESIKAAGAVYNKSIYIITEDFQIWNLAFKGSALSEWTEFSRTMGKRLSDEWVTLSGSEERKKGSVTYTVPTFSSATSMSNSDTLAVKPLLDLFVNYMDSYTNKVSVEGIEDEIQEIEL